MAVDFDEVVPANGTDVSSNHVTEPRPSKGVMFTLGPLALAASFDVQKRTTSCILLGLCEHQVARMIELLQATDCILDNPTLVLVVWLNMMGTTRAHRVMGRKNAILDTETELGTHWTIDSQGFLLNRIDFDRVTRRLTVLGSETGWDLHAIEAQVEMATFVEEFHRSLFGTSTVIQMRIRQAKAVLSGLKHWANVNKQRVHSQAQTVGC